jgi:AcrR family transcriptional regulator
MKLWYYLNMVKITNSAEKKISKGMQSRLRIINVATKLFLKDGLYKVTFQQIADGADLTQSAIYRHFKDMDDLILEACKHWIGEFKEYTVNDSASLALARNQLKEFLDRHLFYAAKNRAQDGLLLGLYYYSMRSKKMLQFYQEIKIRAQAKLKMILHLGNLDGSWNLIHIDHEANTIHSLIVGEVIKTLIEPEAESQTERTVRVDNHVQRLLGISSHLR